MFSVLSLFASMLLSIVQYGEERSLQALVVTSALKILDCPWRKEYSAAVKIQRAWRASKSQWRQEFERVNDTERMCLAFPPHFPEQTECALNEWFNSLPDDLTGLVPKNEFRCDPSPKCLRKEFYRNKNWDDLLGFLGGDTYTCKFEAMIVKLPPSVVEDLGKMRLRFMSTIIEQFKNLRYEDIYYYFDFKCTATMCVEALEEAKLDPDVAYQLLMQKKVNGAQSAS